MVLSLWMLKGSWFGCLLWCRGWGEVPVWGCGGCTAVRVDRKGAGAICGVLEERGLFEMMGRLDGSGGWLVWLAADLFLRIVDRKPGN